NNIAFISGGRILKIGQPAAMKKELSGQILEVAWQPLMKASHLFLNIEGVRGVTVYGTKFNLNFTNPIAVSKKVTEICAKEGITVTSIKQIPASLEDVFSQLAVGDKQDA